MTTTHAPDVAGEVLESGDEPNSDVARPEPTEGPLLPASVTAVRERERLQLADGRRGPFRLLALLRPGIRHLGSAQAAQNGLRYRPVAWTLIVIAALAFYLPGRSDTPVASQPVAAPSPVVPVTPSETPAPPDGPQPTAPLDFTPVAPLPSFSGAPVPTEPPPGEPTPTTAPTSTDDGAPPTTPLSVRGWAWASRLPATPLPTDAVAEGTVPVANRLGSVDRVSFLRLSGSDTRLVLTEHSGSAREALGPGMVAICPVLDSDWEETPGQSFDDAPRWDPEACVGGIETADTWTFDVSRFEDRAGDAGFALVPTVEAPPDFQVAFEVSVR